MTRKSWIVIIVIVAAAAAAAIVGVVAMATEHRDVVAGIAPQMTWDGGDQGRMLGDGDTPGQMFGVGPGASRLAVRVAGDGWRAVYGLPWLAAGLLIGLGVSLLAWRPRKVPGAAVAPAAATATIGSPGAADQWARWHDEAHSAAPAQAAAAEDPAVTATTEAVPAPKAAIPPAGEAPPAEGEPKA